MAIGSTWFTNTDQYNIFKASLDRSLLISKQAQALRMEADIAKLNEKYDGKKAAGLEDDINKIADQKFDISNYLSNVQQGQKRTDDVRTQLLLAKDAIAKGSGEAFDVAINSLNSWIGRQSSDPDSVIANNGTNQGSWAKNVTVVSGAGMSVNLTHQFMGTDYVVTLDNGKVLRPDDGGKAFSGGPNMSDLELVSADSSDPNQVTFKNNVTGEVFNGTISRGGLGVLNAWGYGDISKPDADFDPSTYDPTAPDPDGSAAANMAKYQNRARATGDIDAAMRKLAQIERNLNSYEAGLSGISNGLDGKASQLADEYNKVTQEDLSNKQAERRAIETRFQVATNAMALSNETTATYVYQMFMTSATTEKKSLSDILLSAATGS
jgi:hypothetical protein